LQRERQKPDTSAAWRDARDPMTTRDFSSSSPSEEPVVKIQNG
jgi:hypothetical protein